MWILVRCGVVLFIVSIIILAFIINFRLMPQSLHDYIVDTNFNVPIEYRVPKLPLREFMNKRETFRQEQMVQTRTMFPDQDYEGNVMMGGYHSLLPKNTKWVNHVIEFVT